MWDKFLFFSIGFQEDFEDISLKTCPGRGHPNSRFCNSSEKKTLLKKFQKQDCDNCHFYISALCETQILSSCMSQALEPAHKFKDKLIFMNFQNEKVFFLSPLH